MTNQLCVVLAGGLGTRLRSAVPDVPKCLAPVRGRPFLQWQMESLRARGINRFILSLGYGADKVVQAVESLEVENITCVIEPRALGTGGAIAFALDEIGETEALVANGDTFLGGDLAAMLAPLKQRSGERLRIAVSKVSDRTRFGGIETDNFGRVLRFLGKGTKGPGNINAGIYRVSRDALKLTENDSFSLENEVFPALVKNDELFSAEIEGPFIDIGVPEDYNKYQLKHDQFR